MIVDLVHVQTQDGVRLDGIWRQPSQPNASQLRVDVVILHHGVGGNFYQPGMFDEYSDALLAQGCAVLRVNNRGHGPVNRTVMGTEIKRLGAAFEVVDDCRYDWQAWIPLALQPGRREAGIFHARRQHIRFRHFPIGS